jgi:hypothetical protein
MMHGATKACLSEQTAVNAYTQRFCLLCGGAFVGGFVDWESKAANSSWQLGGPGGRPFRRHVR